MLQVKLFAALVAACVSAANAARKVASIVCDLLLTREPDALAQCVVAACEGYSKGTIPTNPETGKPHYDHKDESVSMERRLKAWQNSKGEWNTACRSVLPAGFLSNLNRLAAASDAEIRKFQQLGKPLNNANLNAADVPTVSKAGRPTGSSSKDAANESAFKAPETTVAAWLPYIHHFAATVAKLPGMTAAVQKAVADAMNDAAARLSQIKPSPLPTPPADNNSK